MAKALKSAVKGICSYIFASTTGLGLVFQGAGILGSGSTSAAGATISRC